MSPDDERRFQREADIVRATQGPDTRMRDERVRKVKAEIGKKDAAAMDTWSREYAGYLIAVQRGEVPRDDTGTPYGFRTAPGPRVR